MSNDDRPRGQRRFTDQFGPATVVIGADGTIRGEITSDASVSFGGTLNGDLFAGGLLRVQSTARITGRVKAAAILVEGHIDGEIEVSGTAELREGCRVTGSISADGVAIADGATFDGTVSMKEGTAEPRDVGFTEKRHVKREGPGPAEGPETPSDPSAAD